VTVKAISSTRSPGRSAAASMRLVRPGSENARNQETLVVLGHVSDELPLWRCTHSTPPALVPRVGLLAGYKMGEMAIAICTEKPQWVESSLSGFEELGQLPDGRISAMHHIRADTSDGCSFIATHDLPGHHGRAATAAVNEGIQ
jgi:hypothetical protein